MTAQRPEILVYNGEAHAMCTHPLADYFGISGDRPNFAKGSTACWRGYRGRWEVIDNRLYLIDLQGRLKDGREVNLQTIFPDCPDRVFANWFNGTARLPQGELLKYVHAGYGSIYERDLLIRFVRGKVAEISVQENGLGWRSWLRRRAGLHRRVIFRDGEVSDCEAVHGGGSAEDLNSPFMTELIKNGMEAQASGSDRPSTKNGQFDASANRPTDEWDEMTERLGRAAGAGLEAQMKLEQENQSAKRRQ